jgi:hypothetical protein
MDTPCRDRGSIVIGWLTKLVVVVSIVGVMLFDVVSVSAAHIGATDDASQAATAAAAAWRSTHNVQSAYQAAVDSLTSDSERILTRGFVIDPDGTVHLLLRRTAKTLLVHRIGPLQNYDVVTAKGQASPPTL